MHVVVILNIIFHPLHKYVYVRIVECQEFIRRVSLYCAPSPTSALDLLQDDSIHYLPTGMPLLDAMLRGGFACGTISELVGRAGVGKSQLALQLCITAAKYNQASIYIDTEQKLSIARLEEMASQRNYNNNNASTNAFSYGAAAAASHSCSVPSTSPTLQDATCEFYGCDSSSFSFKTAQQVLANVTVCTAANTLELLEVVQRLEEEVILRRNNTHEQVNDDNDDVYPVKLVVLDSIAAPTRRDFGGERAPQRVSAVLQLAQILKRLANQWQLAIVVINQVGLDENNNNNNNNNNNTNDNGSTDLVSVKAALGTAWSHCLSTRLLLQHLRDPHRLDDNTNAMDDWSEERGRVRKATIVKSNVAGNESMHYEIDIAGLKEIRVENQKSR
jgi:RAD51-like protein 1